MKSLIKVFPLVLLLIVLLTLFTGCRGDLDDVGLSFGGEYLPYIGKTRESVVNALALDASTEDPSVCNLDQTVEVAGEPYTVQLRFSGAYTGYPVENDPDGDALVLNYVRFERKVESADRQEKTDAVWEVYDLLRTELGEPEPIVQVYEKETLDYALKNGFPTTSVSAKWLLSEEPDYPETDYTGTSYEGAENLLITELQVEFHADSLLIQVWHRIQNTRNSHMERYRDIWHWGEEQIVS